MQPTKAVGVPVSLWLTCSLAWGVSLYMGGCAADPVGTETGSGMAPETAKSETGKSETGQTPGKAEDPMKVAQMPLPSGMEPSIEPMQGAEFPALGSTDFETAKDVDEGGNARPSVSRGDVATNGAAPQAAATPAAESDPAQDSAPVAGVPSTASAGTVGTAARAPSAQREIVEADVIQAHGDILYVLNRYRGLVLIDMSQPDSPYVIGRAPFQAQPVDMYVREGRAYIVMSDYFSYWQFDKGSDPLGFHGSQLLVVDVSDPAHPEELAGFPVDGQVTDTRIVGDVLYAVSKRNPEYWRYDVQDWKDTTWVMSVDISDVKNIHQVDKKEFPGAANLIQVYETALSIAAVDPNYYLVDDFNSQQTLITLVDISDPKGAIKVGGKSYVPGTVQDKFKMDLSDGALRIISQNWYWQPQSTGTLTVFDASDPTQLKQRAQVAVANDVPGGQRYVQPQATRFAGNKLFINLCWYDLTQQCRLDLYDLKAIDKPERVGSMPVDGDITHFEVRGDRLISLGRHYLQNQPAPVQIALYDMANLKAARRLSVVDLTSDWSGSQALNDYKAFKVLEEQHMLLLPLNWYAPTTNGRGNRSFSGAQIVDWENDQLTVRGRVAQQGQVERVVSFKDRVVSVSTKQVQVIDAKNRDNPMVTANLFLVRTILDVFDIKGHQVQLGVDEEDNSYRFYVLPFGDNDMANSVAELEIEDGVYYQIQSGDIVHMVGYDRTGNGRQTIRNADFSDPKKPRWRGSYEIPAEIQHIYNGSYASYYDHFWNINAGQPLNNDLLPVTVREVNAATDGRRFYKNFLRIIDLRNPDSPRLAAGSLEMKEYPFVNRVKHGNILYSTHTEPALDKNGNPKQYHERFFLDRVDVTDPEKFVSLPKVNIPGRLVDVDKSGKLLYTVDYQWDDLGRRRNSFDVLALNGDKASLNTVLPVGDEIDRARYLDREVWLSTHSYPWYGRNEDSADSRQPYTRLTRLRFDEQAKVASNDVHDVDGYHFDLLDVVGNDVYLASSYPTGVLVLDTTDFKNPTVLGAARTVGYVSKIIHSGDYLYFPMRSYGVRRMHAVR